MGSKKQTYTQVLRYEGQADFSSIISQLDQLQQKVKKDATGSELINLDAAQKKLKELQNSIQSAMKKGFSSSEDIRTFEKETSQAFSLVERMSDSLEKISFRGFQKGIEEAERYKKTIQETLDTQKNLARSGINGLLSGLKGNGKLTSQQQKDYTNRYINAAGDQEQIKKITQELLDIQNKEIANLDKDKKKSQEKLNILKEELKVKQQALNLAKTKAQEKLDSERSGINSQYTIARNKREKAQQAFEEKKKEYNKGITYTTSDQLVFGDKGRTFKDNESNVIEEIKKIYDKIASDATYETKKQKTDAFLNALNLANIKKVPGGKDKLIQSDNFFKEQVEDKKKQEEILEELTKAQEEYNKALDEEKEIEKAKNSLDKKNVTSADIKRESANLNEDVSTSAFKNIEKKIQTTEQEIAKAETAVNQLENNVQELENSTKQGSRTEELLNNISNSNDRLKDAEEKILEAKAAESNKETPEVDALRTSTEQLNQDIAENIELSKQQGDSQDRLAQVFNKLSDYVKRYLSLGAVLNQLWRVVKQTYSDVKTLDESFGKIAMVTSYSVQDMWEQYSKYSEMANKLGQSTNSVIEASGLFYQQGLNTNEALKLTEDTMKLATLAGLDFEEATSKMTAALRAFHMEMSEGSHITDVYAELAANAAADVNGIAEAMSKTASIANSAGMSFENTAAFMTQMIETTQEAPENIGTAMKTVIARFTELKENVAGTADSEFEDLDYNKVDKALKTVGIQLKDTAGQFRNLDDVFLELSEKWNDLDRNSQRYIATIAAGSRQQSRFIAMMENYKRTMELIEVAQDSTGKSAEQFAKYSDTLTFKINRLKNSWEALRLSFINSNFFGEVIDSANKLISSLGKTNQFNIAGIAILGVTIGRKLIDNFIKELKNSSQIVADTYKKVFNPSDMAKGTLLRGGPVKVRTDTDASARALKITQEDFADIKKFNQILTNETGIAIKTGSAYAAELFQNFKQSYNTVIDLDRQIEKIEASINTATAADKEHLRVLKEELAKEKERLQTKKEEIAAQHGEVIDAEQGLYAAQNRTKGEVVSETWKGTGGELKAAGSQMIQSGLTIGITTAIMTLLGGGEVKDALKTGLTTALISIIPQVLSIIVPKILTTLATVLSGPLGVAVIVLAIGAILGKAIYDEYINQEKIIQKRIEELEQKITEAGTKASEAFDTAKESKESYKNAKELKEQYDELSKKTVLTTEEQEKYNTLVEQIKNDFPEIVDQYNEITGELKVQNDLWDQIIEKQRKQAVDDIRKANVQTAIYDSYELELSKAELKQFNIGEGKDLKFEYDKLIAQAQNALNDNSIEDLKANLSLYFSDSDLSNLGLNLDLSNKEFQKSLEELAEGTNQYVKDLKNQYDEELKVRNDAIEKQKQQNEKDRIASEIEVAAAAGGFGQTVSSLVSDTIEKDKGKFQKSVANLFTGTNTHDSFGWGNNFKTWDKLDKYEKEFFKETYGIKTADDWNSVRKHGDTYDQIYDEYEDGFSTFKAQKLAEELADKLAGTDIEEKIGNYYTELGEYTIDSASAKIQELKNEFDDVDFTALDNEIEEYKRIIAIAAEEGLNINGWKTKNQSAYNTSRQNYIDEYGGKGQDYIKTINSLQKDKGLSEEQILGLYSTDFSKAGLIGAELFEESVKEGWKKLKVPENIVDEIYTALNDSAEQYGIKSTGFESVTSVLNFTDNVRQMQAAYAESASTFKELLSEEKKNAGYTLDDVKSLEEAFAKISEETGTALNAEDFYDIIDDSIVFDEEKILGVFDKYVYHSTDLLRGLYSEAIASGTASDDVLKAIKESIDAQTELDTKYQVGLDINEKLSDVLERQRNKITSLAESYSKILDGINATTNKISSDGLKELSSVLKNFDDKSISDFVNEDLIFDAEKYKQYINTKLKSELTDIQFNIKLLESLGDKISKKEKQHLQELKETYILILGTLQTNETEKAEKLSDAQEAYNKALKNTADALKAVSKAQEDIVKKQEELNKLLSGSQNYDWSSDAMYNYETNLSNYSKNSSKARDKIFEATSPEEAAQAMKDYRDNSLKEVQNYYAQNEITKAAQQNILDVLNNGLQNALDDINAKRGTNLRLDLGNIITEVNGRININFDNLNNLPDDVREFVVKEAKEWNSLADSIDDNLDKIAEKYKEYQEVQKQGLQGITSVQEKMVSTLKEYYQQEIDNLEDKYSSMKEADDDYINALSEAIEKQRKLREQQNAWDDLATKEKKLSLMQRDTSGANALETAKLEQEVQSNREKLLDDSIDNMINGLKELYELQQESREAEIEYRESLLDEGALMREAIDALAGINSSDDMVAWFMQFTTSLSDMSEEQIELQKIEWSELYDAKAAYMETSAMDLEDFLTTSAENIDEVIQDTSQKLIDQATTDLNILTETLDSSIKSAQDAVVDAVEALTEKTNAYNDAIRAEAIALGELKKAQGEYEEAKKSLDIADDTADSGALDIFKKVARAGIDKTNQVMNTLFSQKENSKQAADYVPGQGGTNSPIAPSVNNGEGWQESISAMRAKDAAFNKAKRLHLLNANSWIQNGKDFTYNDIVIPTDKYTYSEDEIKKAFVELNNNEDELNGKLTGYSLICVPGKVNSYQFAPNVDTASRDFRDGYKKLKQFATGGLVDYTGPAWVDGTPSKPEAFLSQEDTERIGNAAKLLSDLPLLQKDWLTTKEEISNTNVGDTSIEIHINVENVSSDYDVDQAVERVKKDIVEAAQFRGSNVILRR